MLSWVSFRAESFAFTPSSVYAILACYNQPEKLRVLWLLGVLGKCWQVGEERQSLRGLLDYLEILG